MTSTSISGVLRTFDSLNQQLTDSTLEQLAGIYTPDRNIRHPVIANMKEMKVKHKQHGSVDCGVFAIIAFAVDLALGRNPDDVAAAKYNQSRMRKHLEESFRRGCISPFPKRK